MKPIKAWAIVSPFGEMICNTKWRTMDDVIHEREQDGPTMDDLTIRGYRAVKVKILEVEE